MGRKNHSTSNVESLEHRIGVDLDQKPTNADCSTIGTATRKFMYDYYIYIVMKKYQCWVQKHGVHVWSTPCGPWDFPSSFE